MEQDLEKYISVNGMNIRYAERGEGLPLLLIHGFCEFLETWDFNFRPLSAHHRVFALDLPGHGLSDKPYLEYDLAFYTDFVVDFMQALGVSRTAVVGHSFGGAIGIDLAYKYPATVSHLVLESSFGLSKDITLLHKLCSMPVITDVAASPAERQVALEERVKLEFYAPDFAAREIVGRSYQFMRMPEARRVMLNIMHNWVDPNGLRPDVVMTDRLPEVALPTLFIHCSRDRIHPLRLSQRARHLMPNARLKVLSECGHCPHIERAVEFNEAVIDFLAAD